MAVPNIIANDATELEVANEYVGDVSPLDTRVYHFRKLLRSRNTDCNSGGCRAQTIVHSVAGLYLATLQSMDKETVYDVLTEEDSFTIVCLSKSNVILEHMKQRLLNTDFGDDGETTEDELETNEECLLKRLKDYNLNLLDSDDDTSSDIEDFQLVYSSEFSNSSDDVEAAENGTAEPVTQGKTINEAARASRAQSSASHDSLQSELLVDYKQYIGGCIRRKLDLLRTLRRFKNPDAQNLALSECHSFENELTAACSFRVRHCSRKNLRIIHINFLSVRKYLRGKGLGSLLIDLMKDDKIVGPYNALVVHADLDAQGFFKKHGFTSDVLLNCNWDEFAGDFVNCKLMTYVPGFTERSRIRDTHLQWNMSSLFNVDKCIEDWRAKAVEAHIEQCTLLQRLRNELQSAHYALEQKKTEIELLYSELRHAYIQLRDKRTDGASEDKLETIDERIRELDMKLGSRGNEFTKSCLNLPEVKCGGDRVNTEENVSRD